MRRDTMLAIVVAVVSIGLGLWYLGPGDTNDRPTGQTAQKTEDGSQPSSPAALIKDDKPPMSPIAARPKKEQTGTAGSPSATNVRDSVPSLHRPQPKETAKPPRDTMLGQSLESTDVTQPTRALVKERASVGTVSAKTTDATTTRPASVESVIPDAKKPIAKKLVDAKPVLRTHTVQYGDNLWNLAVKYLGDGRRYREIVKLNPTLNPNRIKAGDKIIIPAAAGTSSPQSATGLAVASTTGTAIPGTNATVTMKPKPIQPDRSYQVKSGEGWYILAQRFLGDGSRWPELYEINKGRVPRNKDILPAGSVIELPKGVKAAP